MAELTAFLRYCDGDRGAFEEVVRDYAGPAYAVAYRVLGEPTAAEEAVQEAFIRVWERAAAFDRTRGNERTWILSVVRNQSIDLLRKRERHPARSIDDDPVVYALRGPDDVWEEVAATLEGETVRKALLALPAEQRDTLEMAYFRGLRPVEISRATGVAEGTVRSRLRLGLQRLRQILASPGEAVEA